MRLKFIVVVKILIDCHLMNFKVGVAKFFIYYTSVYKKAGFPLCVIV